MSADCLFCRIVAGEIPSTKVHEDDLVVAIRDISPRAPTHVLLMPREHIASAAELTDADGTLLGRLFAVAAEPRTFRGDRRSRLPPHHERGGVGRPVRAAPPPASHGRPAVRLAARLRASVPGIARRPALLALVAVALVVAACRPPATPPPAPDPTPRPTISPAVSATQVQLEGALRARGLTLQATEIDVRLGEPPSVAAAPRTALRAILPDDPAGGLVVVYELPDAAAAAAAAADLAAHITSGPGRVQFPPDVRHVLRQVGSTIVFFPWSPGSSPDERTADVAAAVATVGTEVPIPRG